MLFFGVIHEYESSKRYFSAIKDNKVVYFYMQNSILKKFQGYLHKGRFVSFEYDENDIKYIACYKTYVVKNFIKIIKNTPYKQEIYYDIGVIKRGIKDFINQLNNLMFLDLELTMHDYNMPKNFKSEIIQAGIVITNKKYEILEKIEMRIKPTKFKLSRRTIKFLNLDLDDYSNWVSYKEFYKVFQALIKKYNPHIVVWGKNDILAINDSFVINKVSSLDKITNYVNLLQIIKNYYNYKNDLALFKALEMFTNYDIEAQKHDALEDALVTLEVFKGFKSTINTKRIKKMIKEE